MKNKNVYKIDNYNFISHKILIIGGMKSDLYHRQLFSNLKGRGESVAIVGKVVKIYPEERRLLLECDP